MSTQTKEIDENHEDVCRNAILRTLYSHYTAARGVRSSGMKIRKLQQALRPQGYKQQDVARNLTYLIDKGWVSEVSRSRQVRLHSGMVIDNEDLSYRISDVGVDRIQGASVFQHNPAKFQGINISNIGGVVTVGDGNVVNARLSEVAQALEQLIHGVEKSPDLSDPEKLDISADLTSLRAQLAKPAQDGSLVQRLWKCADRLSMVSGLVSLVQTVGTALHTAGLL